MKKELLSLLFILFFLGGNVVNAQSIPTALSQWNLDEGYGVLANDAIGDVDLSLNNNPDWAEGIYNSAILLNGTNQDASTSTAPTLEVEGDLTITSHIKVDPTLSEWGWIAGLGDNYGLYVNEDGNLQFYFYNGSDWTGVAGSINIRDGKWHFVSGIFNSSTGKAVVFVDSILDNSSSVSGNISYEIGHDVHIGSMQSQRFFKGVIDDVRIFDIALTNLQLKDIKDDKATKPETYTLTINTINGSVTPDGGTFNSGAAVELNALSDIGYIFESWSGDFTGSESPATIIMDENKTITAKFIEANIFTLTTNVSGSGTISVSPESEGGKYSTGTTVTLSAIPEQGWIFDYWSGDTTGTNSIIDITINSNMSITANFKEIEIPTANYFVATYGDDSNTGTQTQPFKTIQKGYSVLKPGEVLIVFPGNYPERVTLKGNNGEKDNLISIMGIDFTHKPIITGGVYMENCTYVHFKNFEVTVTQLKGTGEGFNNNVLENLNVHHVTKCPWGDLQGFSVYGGAHHNLFLNCDFHDNQIFYGSNADGLGFSMGEGEAGGPHDNTIRYCRSYFNNDDGFDTWWSGANNRFEGCWSYGNGKDSDFNNIDGDGNGFKLGQGKYNAPFLVNCIAFENRNRGFDENANQAGGIILYNCTAYSNDAADYGFWSAPQDTIRNCVTVSGDVSEMDGADDRNNNWNLNIKADANDFITLDYSANLGPRKSDGSLPESSFLHLKKGSDLIDKGIDLGFPYKGLAPDLGAYEYDSTTTSVFDIIGSTNRVNLSNYPNPFSNTTSISYTIDKPYTVTLAVFDVVGKVIDVLVNKTHQNSGHYVFNWNGSRLDNGVYFIQLKYGVETTTKKIILSR